MYKIRRNQLHLPVVIVYHHLLARVEICDEMLDACWNVTIFFAGKNFWSYTVYADCIVFIRNYHLQQI